ncbi:MAG: hypothetical protein WKH97_18580 [Casimicrobiaceae bacterium]
MNNPLQHVPALLKRRAQWPVSDPATDHVVGDSGEHTSFADNEATLEGRPELCPSSPGGYNPYWDLPPA